MVKINPNRAGITRKFSDHFGASSENVRDIKREKDPQDKSGSLGQFSRSDTAEKPAKLNIQGVEIHLVELNNKFQIPTVPVMAGKFTGGEAASPTTPRRAVLASTKSKDAVRLSDVTTSD